MGKTFGPLKRPGKGAVPALLRKQPTTAKTQTATAADDEAAKSWKTDRSSNKMHGMIDGGHLPKRLVPSSAVRKSFPILAFKENNRGNSHCRIGIAHI